MPYQALTIGETGELNPRVESYDMAAQNIAKGQLCFIIDGNVTIATDALDGLGHPVFVPIESKDNSGGAAGDLQIKGVGREQVVSLDSTEALDAGDYVRVSATAGKVMKFVTGTDAESLIVAQYLGKEAGVWARAGTTPFRETISSDDIKPLDLAADTIGFFRLGGR